jgi:hypothetical protein
LGVIHLFKIQFFLWNINRKRGRSKVGYSLPWKRVTQRSSFVFLSQETVGSCNFNRKKEKKEKRKSNREIQRFSLVLMSQEKIFGFL